MSKKRSNGSMPWWLWLIITHFIIAFEVIDFLFWVVPIFGTAWDLFGLFLAYIMAGVTGIIYIWELLLATPVGNGIDGFIPTLLLLWLYVNPPTKVKWPWVKKRGKK